MVKLDYKRNYYADLEISPQASFDDIKKQFRKLGVYCSIIYRVVFFPCFFLPFSATYELMVYSLEVSSRQESG